MTIRQTLGATTLAFLLFATGCGALNAIFPDIGLNPSVPIQCIALYERVGPDQWVGHDGCQNYWLKEVNAEGDTLCSMWDDSLGHVRIGCPDEEEDL